MQSKGVIDDVGRHLAKKWEEVNHLQKGHYYASQNPWSLKNIERIKYEFDADRDGTMQKYPELFYYYDGLLDTKISQSVHPAGIVISPITLADNYGVFDKDNENCLMLDMDNVHDFTGLAKYDFLILKTVQIIRDTCRYLGQPYPKTHEIDWNDEKVWRDMIRSPSGIFQFEGRFAFDCLRKFKPKNIFEMSLVTACIRPSGASYRDDLLARHGHKNPSSIIDDLLKDNLGWMVYQEDTIKFLQQICGLSGSEADNIRRAIGRKQKDRLDKAMPDILEGYCRKSPQPRDVAEKEAKEFLQIIEDSASYQFGYNHSIAYCLLGYLCAYYRFYHPLEFITAYLNNAANDDDIERGTEYANLVGIKITMPKFGFSKADYFFDKEQNVIAKGLSSVKYLSGSVADELYVLAHDKQYDYFVDLLTDIDQKTRVDSRQLNILIKIDFFSSFGNQRELFRIIDLFYGVYKKGSAKKISKERVDGSPLESIVAKYSAGETKSGASAKSYTILNMESILRESETAILDLELSDLDILLKIQNFKDAMGYAGYISGKEEDRRKLYVLSVYPLLRKKDKKQFGYSVITKSIGSGKESRFTVMNSLFNKDSIKEGDIVYCKSFKREGSYYQLTDYYKIH